MKSVEYGEFYVDSVGFFYYPEENVFRDEDGNIAYDVYSLVPAWFIDYFKYCRDEYMVYEVNSHFVVELYYDTSWLDDLTRDDYLYAVCKYDSLDYNGPCVECSK